MEAATSSPHAASDVLKLKYFDLSGFGGLSGRGGSVRFFLLANGIPFTEEVVDWAGWGAGLKQEAMASGESPTGHLPLVYLPGSSSSSPPLLETFAILRRLAKRDGQYGSDEERDYAADVAADATVEFRSALLDSAFGGPDAKLSYTTSPDKRPHFYSVMEALLQRFGSSSSHAVGSSASFADAVVFAVLWDDVAVHGHDEALWGSNPRLAGFFRAYLAQPAVLGWCKGARPDLCDGAAAAHA
uniref:GST N-terminal domain-containing protein n=1 Tax=Tetradesmus obliquus TaxID=3088 RepID=A0A383V3Y5_TETOB|eukprot:jgi/Sobl393_1/13611/SZX60327.1